MPHHCALDTESGAHGSAVTSCYEDDDGYLWLDNGEYASMANYCPGCGFQAKRPARPWKPMQRPRLPTFAEYAAAGGVTLGDPPTMADPLGSMKGT